MTRIVAIVLLGLLLPSPTVASEVNGKALICFSTNLSDGTTTLL